MRKQGKVNFLLCAFVFFIGLMGINDARANNLKADTDAVSKLIIYEQFQDFENFSFNNCQILDNNLIDIKTSSKEKINKGEIISPSIKSEFPMTEIIPSWNMALPAGTGAAVYFQISPDGSKWTEWLFIGKDGDTPEKIDMNTNSEYANVDTDFVDFTTTSTCMYYKFKIDFYTKSAGTMPSLLLFAVSCGNNGAGSDNTKLYKNFLYNKSNLPPKEKWAHQLCVPYRSQLDEKDDISWGICCPTSIAMVLDYYGKKFPTRSIAEAAFDPHYQIYGSWWRATQTFSLYGFKSYVVQIRDFDQFKEYIAKDIPVVISIKAEKGELPSSSYKETPGHVLVLIGFDGEENVYVNDPYNTDGVRGTQKWTKKELIDVMIKKGGVAVIAEPSLRNKDITEKKKEK